MGILLWILLGAIAGWIASTLMHSPTTLMMDILLGIIGALIGGFVMNAFGEAGVTGFNLYSVVVAVLGAVLLIGAKRVIQHV